MMKKVGFSLLALVLVFVVLVATRPATTHIERSLTIAAPAEVVFPLINDFHQWLGWSPWDKLDPTMKRTYEGAPSGVGSKYSWVGNDKVGEGRMTIEESKPNDHVRITLEFLKPFVATNTTLFVLKPEGFGVTLTWSMDGTNNFMAKAVGLFMDMDKMVGGDFERGLAGINDLAVKEAARRAEAAKEAARKAAAAVAAAQPVVAPAPAPK